MIDKNVNISSEKCKLPYFIFYFFLLFDNLLLLKYEYVGMKQ